VVAGSDHFHHTKYSIFGHSQQNVDYKVECVLDVTTIKAVGCELDVTTITAVDI